LSRGIAWWAPDVYHWSSLGSTGNGTVGNVSR
jgi:hypothetical protein